MQQYVVTGKSFGVPVGSKVELSPEQHRPRSYALKPLSPLPEKWEKAIFEVVQPIEFKEGERVVTNVSVGKAQMVQVVPVKKFESKKAEK